MPGTQTIKYSLAGFKELQSALDKFARNSTKERILRQALMPAAMRVHALARMLVPVRTGGLKKSIVVRPAANLRRGVVGLVIGHTGRWTRMGHLVEFGTQHSAAQPYMRPALRAVKGTLGPLTAAEFRKIVAKEATNTRLLKAKGR